MRSFNPRKSCSELISLRYQPPIWAPVLPDGIDMTFDFAMNSFTNSRPPP